MRTDKGDASRPGNEVNMSGGRASSAAEEQGKGSEVNSPGLVHYAYAQTGVWRSIEETTECGVKFTPKCPGRVAPIIRGADYL